MDDRCPVSELVEDIDAALDVGRIPALEGPPGLGKSALFQMIADKRNMNLVVVLGSSAEATDLTGFPVVGRETRKNRRGEEIPIARFAPRNWLVEADVSDRGTLLFFDEFTTSRPDVMNVLLTAMHGHQFGDYKADPDKVAIALAYNDPEVVVDGHNIGLATSNRIMYLQYPGSKKEERPAAAREWCRNFPTYWDRPKRVGYMGKYIPEAIMLQARSYVSGYIFRHPTDTWYNPPTDETQIGKEGWPSPRCYDADTEVLTDRGFVRWPDVTDADRFATRDQDGNVSYHKPVRLYAADYRGPMYRFHRRGMVDLLVTPNHNMLCAEVYRSAARGREGLTTRDGVFRLDTAAALVERLKRRVSYRLRFTQTAAFNRTTEGRKKIGDREVDWGDWAEFLGWYLTDGYLAYNRRPNGDRVPSQIRITQRKEKNRRRILDLMRRIGCPTVSEYTDKAAAVGDRALWDELAPLGRKHAGERYVPRDVMAQGPEVIRRLITGLVGGDGWVSKGTTTVAVGPNPRLAADIQEAQAVLGLASYCRTRLQRGRTKEVYHITLRSIRHGQPLVSAGDVSVEEYAGRVYCAEVPNHTLLVRRNSQVVWSGNSWDFVSRHIGWCICNNRPVTDCLRRITGEVGASAAAPFLVYVREASLPDPEKILEDPDKYHPSGRPDVDYATVMSVVASVRSNLTAPRFEGAAKIVRAVADGKTVDKMPAHEVSVPAARRLFELLKPDRQAEMIKNSNMAPGEHNPYIARISKILEPFAKIVSKLKSADPAAQPDATKKKKGS